MTIDLHTMYVAMAATCFIVAASFSIINAGRFRRDGTFLWALGWAFQGGFWALIGFRGILPDFLSIVVANTCVIASYSLLYCAIRQFLGRPYGRVMLLLPSAVTFIVCFLSVYVDFQTSRIVLISFFAMFQTGATIRMLFRSASGRERRSYWLTGSAFVVAWLITLIRFLQVFALPYGQASLAAAAPFRNAGVMASFGVAILSSMGFMLMTKGRAELALRENEQRLRSLFETCRDSILLINQETGEILGANPAGCRLYGYSPEEFLKMNVTDISAEPEKTRASVLHAITEVPLRLHRKKDGTIFPIEVSGGYFTEGSLCLHTAFIRDITERKEAEDNLRTSQLQLSDAAHMARIAHWEYDGTTDEFILNDVFYALYGTTVEREGGYRMTRTEHAKRFIHPDDIEDLRRQVAENRDPHPRPDAIEQYEHRGIRRDGEIVHILTRNRVILDEEGHILRVVGVNQDITARKKMEDALGTSHERYRRLFDEASEGIGLADYDTGIIRDCNQAFLKLTGYERSEVVGHSQKMLHPEEKGDPAFTRAFELHRSLKQGQALIETIVTKSGALKEVEIKTDIIEIDGSKMMEGFFRDVTEEHRLRRERETSLRLLGLLTGQNDTRDVVRGALDILQEWTGCEAAGVRLQEGSDFPYAETRGFHPEFVEAENSISTKGPGDRAFKGVDGTLKLQCMCGAVLSGRCEPGFLPFTRLGSVWTNNAASQPLCPNGESSSFTARNRCVREGYESLALIPLKSGGQVLGLLQLNDRRKDRFSPEIISFLENAGEQIAIAVAQRQAQAALAVSEKRFRDISEAAGEFLFETDCEGRFTFVSDRVRGVLGYDAGDLVGRTPSDIMPPSEQEGGLLFFRDHRQKGTGFRDRETRALTESGRMVWLNVTAVPILDACGGLLGYRGAAMDITKRKQAEEQLRHDALYDDLTGLSNRALFIDRLDLALRRCNHAENDSCAVIFLDLDRFKVVNDSLGHMVGDRLLKEAAQRLERCIRPGDTLARLGGDEFVMLFEDVKEVETAKAIAERIQEVLSAPFVMEGTEIRCSASIGIALTSKDYQFPEEVLRDADITMYRAKTLGKARYEVFDPAMRLEAAAVLQLENDLRRALEMDELRIQYQPIIALAGERTLGFEALLRWDHPRHGLVRPDDFIPLAEETGLIVPIGEWVLRKACSQTRVWRDRGWGPMRVAVNISAVQLRRSDFVTLVEKIVGETGAEPHLLDLEITESVLMDRNESMVVKFLELKELGARICLDDFGTGYSSLSYLQGLPIDVLKIDRSFTMNLESVKENRKIIETIHMLGRSLGAEVIAEGIETREQLEYLREIGCDCGQGFLFSRPLDEKGLDAFMAIAGISHEAAARPRGIAGAH